MGGGGRGGHGGQTRRDADMRAIVRDDAACGSCPSCADGAAGASGRRGRDGTAATRRRRHEARRRMQHRPKSRKLYLLHGLATRGVERVEPSTRASGGDESSGGARKERRGDGDLWVCRVRGKPRGLAWLWRYVVTMGKAAFLISLFAALPLALPWVRELGRTRDKSYWGRNDAACAIKYESRSTHTQRSWADQ